MEPFRHWITLNVRYSTNHIRPSYITTTCDVEDLGIVFFHQISMRKNRIVLGCFCRRSSETSEGLLLSLNICQ